MKSELLEEFSVKSLEQRIEFGICGGGGGGGGGGDGGGDGGGGGGGGGVDDHCSEAPTRCEGK